MTKTATHNEQDTTTERTLFVAFALREKTWTLGFPIGHGQKPRERPGAARHQARVLREVAPAKQRFGLSETAPGVSCYAAGREGCWRPRFLQAQGIANAVGDASSIAVKRRQRRAQSAALDVRQWGSLRMRYAHGEREGWRGGHVPWVAAEDRRHRHRALETRKPARASTPTRLKGLRRSQGGRLTRWSQLPAPLEARRLGEGSPIPSGLRQRVLRVSTPHELLRQQSAEWEAERRALLQRSPDAAIEPVRPLRPLQGRGSHGAG